MVHLGIRISEDLKKKLLAMAKKENRSLSGQLIHLIEKAVKK
jgi:predicted CopG family antitoxin